MSCVSIFLGTVSTDLKSGGSLHLKPLQTCHVAKLIEHSIGSDRGRLDSVLRAGFLCGGHPSMVRKYCEFLKHQPVEVLVDTTAVCDKFLDEVDIILHFPAEAWRALYSRHSWKLDDIP
eukprot:393715_1